MCLAVVAASVVGCGDGRQRARPAERPVAAPTAIEACGAAGAGWRRLVVEQGGLPVVAAVLGSGPAVTFVNDSGNDPCDWMELARRVAARGRAVAVFSYRTTDAANERDTTAQALAVARAAAGGRRFVLVGASLGGRVVFQAAALRPRGLAGVVSLSGERQVGPYSDILDDVRRVTVPVLYVGSTEDPLTEGTRQPKRIAATLRVHPAQFVMLDGFDHGAELLVGADGPRVVATVDRFVGRHLR